jgi:succinoglycan biosynthesis transport protein ExoP
MATEYELTLADYLSAMRRRANYLIGIFVAGLLITIVVAFSLPKTYRATGTIMVESQQVSDSMVSSAIRNKFEERISVIKQRVMTRENMVQLANKYSLFKEKLDSRTPSELIDRIRGRIEIESITPTGAGSSNWQGQPTIAFTISFEDPRPEISLEATKEVIAMFLDWNVKLRTEGATETTVFLTQEADRLKVEIDRMEEKISTFKKQNSENLPEQLNMRTAMLARAENDLYAVDRDIRSGSEELRSLEVELSAAKRGMSENPTQTLPALKAEFTKLSAIYTESHPDIRALKRKIDALEHGSNELDKDDSANATSLAEFKIKAKIESVNARMESLAQQKKMLQGKIAQNEHAMELTPRVGQGLDVLMRDRDTAQKKYEEILGKKMSAKISENLESENKSERFSLLEPPLLPEKPFKPNRAKILAMGFFLAMLASGGLVMFLELIDKRIRGAEALTHVLGYRPLVVIPYLYIEGERESTKLMRLRAMFDTQWQRLESTSLWQRLKM